MTTEQPNAITEAITEALAAAGVPNDIATLFADSDTGKYVTSDGSPDTDAIAELAARVAAQVTPPPKAPQLHQGRRGTPPRGQLSRADLANMSSEDIEQARTSGQLAHLLEGRTQ